MSTPAVGLWVKRLVQSTWPDLASSASMPSAVAANTFPHPTATPSGPTVNPVETDCHKVRPVFLLAATTTPWSSSAYTVLPTMRAAVVKAPAVGMDHAIVRRSIVDARSVEPTASRELA
jgi:hypothetical protein